jgi:hypothetical protein
MYKLSLSSSDRFPEQMTALDITMYLLVVVSKDGESQTM